MTISSIKYKCECCSFEFTIKASRKSSNPRALNRRDQTAQDSKPRGS